MSDSLRSMVEFTELCQPFVTLLHLIFVVFFSLENEKKMTALKKKKTAEAKSATAHW